MNQKAEFSESVEEQDIFNSNDVLCPNMQQHEEILEQDETTQPGDCPGDEQNTGNIGEQNTRNIEKVMILEISPSAAADTLKEEVS
jgi:hypothetical protein